MTGDGGGTIKVWDLHAEDGRGACVMDILGHRNAVRGLSFTPNGNILLSGGDDYQLRSWNIHEVDKQIEEESGFTYTDAVSVMGGGHLKVR